MHLSSMFFIFLTFIAGSSLLPTQSFSEPVGKAVSIRTMVSGDKGVLKRADPVDRNERISTNNTGLGQFQFADGTKLAVGPNSSIVIDEYVLASGNRVKKLAMNSTKGAFRWISGKSPSSAYAIATPVGTLGVRGTAVDLYIGDNIAMMVLLNGSSEWCNDGRCVAVDRPCDFIIARGGTDISDPQRINATALSQLGGPSSLYFFNNIERLHPAFRTAQSSCGLGNRLRTRSGSTDAPAERSQPDRGGEIGEGD
jgi:hypothetical protein